MNRKYLLYLSFVLLVGIFTLWGCPKKAEVATAPETQTQAEKVPPPTTTPSPATEAAIPEGTHEKSGTMAEGLKPIYFDFDKSFIREDAMTVMQTNMEWLRRPQRNGEDRGQL